MPFPILLLAALAIQNPSAPTSQGTSVFRAVKDAETVIDEPGLRPVQLSSELRDLKTDLDGGETAGLRRYVLDVQPGESVKVALTSARESDLRLLFSFLRPHEGVVSNLNRSAIMAMNRMTITKRNGGLEFRNHQKEVFRLVANVLGRLGFPYQLKIERRK